MQAYNVSDCARQGYHYPIREMDISPSQPAYSLSRASPGIHRYPCAPEPALPTHLSSVLEQRLLKFLDCEFRLHFHAVCLTNADYDKKSVPYCACHPLLTVLIRHGLFPSAPHQPHIAFASTLLDFYQSLFERACDAINVLASALHSFYERRGFYLWNQQGLPALNPFRRSLSCAVQWYDCLLVRAKDQADKVLEECLGLAQSSSMTVDDV